jgi:hypothetical protein
LGRQRRVHRLRRLAQQPLDRRQRQAHPRPAVGRGVDRVPRQMPQAGRGGVEVQDLQDEQVQRLDRPPFS